MDSEQIYTLQKIEIQGITQSGICVQRVYPTIKRDNPAQLFSAHVGIYEPKGANIALLHGFQDLVPIDTTAAPPQQIYLPKPQEMGLLLAYLCGNGCPNIVVDFSGLQSRLEQNPHAVVGTASALDTIARSVLVDPAKLVVAGVNLPEVLKGTALAGRYEKGISSVDEVVREFLK